jgi:hypothetical protein
LLFSNYYLSRKLAQDTTWDTDETREAFRRVSELYSREKESLHGLNEGQLEQHFFRPVFEVLGFTFEVFQKVQGRSRFPDYAFFADEQEYRHALDEKSRSGEQAFYDCSIGIGEVKQWDLELDRIGKAETRDNPSFQIWLYLQQTRDRWGLLSNGRLWRVFSRDHYFDIFFEVDLVKILEDGDYPTFLYFFHFFSRRAFTRRTDGESFLDKTLEKSLQQSKDVGNSLKENVYRAMRILAQGFVEVDSNRIDKLQPEMLERVQQNTMRLLYRLLFILYAEGRGLFRDPRYFESGLSLRELKGEIARRKDRGQPVLQASNEFWDRLQRLFKIVDLGSTAAGFSEISIPPYNGGLFDPERNPFLASKSLGNRAIGEAIDLLSRAELEDGKLGFVDYSTLEIRHLGGIYEGLLEYHIRVAVEPMVAVGPTLDWLPYSEYSKTRRAPIDFEKFSPDDRASPGELFISTSKGERKATGSYYTPEPIVDYIVASVLGPIIAAKKAKAAVDGNSRSEAILETRVLDPAMGSGHFLLEAVDYIATELVRGIQEDLLAGISLEQPPETYTLDWAKRQVATRCVFGVDINETAVELAKVALWLHTIAQDKPLSFLDHHLKCGNSLVGAWIVDLAWQPGARRKGVQIQVDKPFGLVEKILSRLRAIAAVSDDSVAGVKRKSSLYASLLGSDEYTRIKTLADTHLGLCFLKADPASLEKSYQSLVNEAYYGDVKEWARKSKANWVRDARAIATDFRFFHWELEFPEAFFDTKGAREDSGFDCVIGNPPYVRVQDLPHVLVDFFKRPEEFNSATLRTDISVLFFERGLQLGTSSSTCSYIASSQFMKSDYGVGLRGLLGKTASTCIIDLADAAVFEEALTYTAIFRMRKSVEPEVRYRAIHASTLSQVAQALSSSPPEEEWIVLKPPRLDGTPWVFQEKAGQSIMSRVVAGSTALSEVADPEYGVLTGCDDVMVLASPGPADALETTYMKKIAWPESLARWAPSSPKTLVIYPYESSEGRARILEEAKLRIQAPRLMEYLERHRDQLENRKDSRGKFSERGPWYGLVRYSHPDTIAAVKILCPGVSKTPKFALDRDGLAFIGKGVTAIVPRGGSPYALLGLLNSELAAWIMDAISPLKAGGYRTYSASFLAKFPVKRVLVAPWTSEDSKAADRYCRDITRGFAGIGAAGPREAPPPPNPSDLPTPGARVCALSRLSETLFDLRTEANARSVQFSRWLGSEIVHRRTGRGIEELRGKGGPSDLLTLVPREPDDAFELLLDWLRKNHVYTGPISSADRGGIRAEFDSAYSRVREIGMVLKTLESAVNELVYSIYDLTPDDLRNIRDGRTR